MQTLADLSLQEYKKVLSMTFTYNIGSLALASSTS